MSVKMIGTGLRPISVTISQSHKPVSCPDYHSHRRDDPDCCGSSRALYAAGPAHQHAGSEKANSGDNLRCDSTRITGVAGKGKPDHGKDTRAKRNERHRTQTRRLILPFPFNSYPTTTENCQ